MTYTRTRTTLEPGKLYRTTEPYMRAYYDKPVSETEGIRGDSRVAVKRENMALLEEGSVLLAVSDENPPECLDMGHDRFGFWVVYNETKVWICEDEFRILERVRC